MIHKQVPEGQRYTQISNEVLQSEHLSLLAKGLLAVLLSHPPNFKVTADWIHRHCDEGRLRVRKVLAELQEAGYLEKRSERNDKGHVIEWIWDVNQGDKMIRTIDEITELESPDVQKVVSGQVGPGVQKCTSGRPVPIYKKQTNKEKVNQKEKTKQTALPAWLSEELWKDFTEHRKLIRKPLTPLAVTRILKTLEQVAADYSEAEARKCLDTSIASGWPGVFPPKAPAATSPRYQSADEKNQATLDAFLKEDTNGKQGNDSAGTDRVFSQHRKNDTKRTAIRLVEGLQRRTG
jgi:hypothetical protein